MIGKFRERKSRCRPATYPFFDVTCCPANGKENIAHTSELLNSLLLQPRFSSYKKP